MNDDGLKDKDGASQSPEARAFEEGLRKILQTPKSEVDKEMEREKKAKRKKTD